MVVHTCDVSARKRVGRLVVLWLDLIREKPAAAAYLGIECIGSLLMRPGRENRIKPLL